VEVEAVTSPRSFARSWFRWLLVGLVVFGYSTAVAQTRTYTLRISMVIGQGDPLYDGYVRFGEAVEARTNGGIQVQVFPDAQLGADEDVMEQALLGVDVAFNTDAGRLAVRVPPMGIVLAPYAFDDVDQAQAFLASDLWQGWAQQLEDEHGLTVLALNYYVGARHFLTKRPILTPADLRGLRIRTPGAPVWQETIRALGATPVALPWIETYPAMQQGVVDGAEAQHPGSYGLGLHTIGNQISKTGHILLMNGPVVGTNWLRTLPAEYQQILREEAFAAGQWTSAKVLEMEADFEARMVAEGATVHEVDPAPFRAAAQAMYPIVGLAETKAQLDAFFGR
jgi:TRAP-type transport system periplasmic protein